MMLHSVRAREPNSDENQVFGLVSTNDGEALRSFLEFFESKPDAIDLNIQGKGGQTPLMFAVLRGKEQAVKVLLKAGVDTTIGEQDGYTREFDARCLV